MKTISVKWMVTLAAMLVLLGLGLLKGSWSSASAGTVPTIPTIPGTEITPTDCPIPASFTTTCTFIFPANPTES